MLKHKKALRSILSLLLIVYLVVVTPVSAFAESWDDSLIETTTTSEVIIGESDVIPQPRIPNWLVLDWDATATQVIISVQNVGVDTVDICSGTVYVENVYAGSFTITNIAPLSTRTATVNTSMKKCYENIVVNYYGVDGGTEFAEGSSPGHREIPSSLSSIWQQGSFSTTYASINYHFSTHGAEVGTTNIVDYATKAKNYRNSV